MYEKASLVFKSYMPMQLEKGMLFLSWIKDVPYIRSLENVPFDEDEYIFQNGYPVEPYVIYYGNPNLNEEYILAGPEEIGWFDEGEHSEYISDISVKHYNTIIQDYESEIELEIDANDEESVRPMLYEGKITIRYPREEEFVEEDDDDSEYTESDEERWLIDESRNDEI
jgi:hypothetical protein